MTSLINTLLGTVAIQLFLCGWLGYAAIAIYRRKRNVDWLAPARSKFIHLVFAPVAGLLIFFWVAELTLPFPQGAALILIALLAFATWENAWHIKNQRFSLLSGIVLLAFFALLSFLIVYNGQDLIGISAHDYFPRTNGDTFSYLSHIEQFQYKPLDLFQPLKQDTLIYPASFRGFFIPHERNGVSALGAFFANGLSIETHVIFFSTLRLLLACMILGFLSILLLIKLPAWIIAPCFLIYVFGCFQLHSVLQQFFSATAGILAGMAVIFCTCLWIESGYRQFEAFLAGSSLGLLLVYSPETFPTLFLASSFFLLLTLMNWQARGKIKSLSLTLFVIFGGVLVTSLPLIFEPATLIWTRLTKLQDFQAAPYKVDEIIGFGLHLVGLRSGLGWSGISAPERFILYFLIFVIFVGSSLLLARALTNNIFSARPWDGRMQVGAYLSVLAATYVGLQVIFEYQRLSYPWIKTMDYFNFLPCLILGLMAEWLAGQRAGLRRLLTVVGLMAFTAIFIKTAIPAKTQIFSFYRSSVIEQPPIDAFLYAEPNEAIVTGISPSMRGFSLELFYYMNRWRETPLEVHMADKVGAWASYRYLQEANLVPRASHRFCLERKWNIPEIQKDCENLTGSALSWIEGSAARKK